MKKGVGKLNAPIVMHLVSRKRFFNAANYLLRVSTASKRFLVGMRRWRPFSTMLIPHGIRLPKISRVALLLGVMMFCAIPLLALGDPAPNSGDEDFGQYLLNHQSDLAPFFAKNGSQLLTLAVPLLLAWIGKILFFAFLAGWAVDVVLGRGFAYLFAPRLAPVKPNLTYATGRLALTIVVMILLGASVIAAAGSPQLEAILIILLFSFILISAVLQIGWIHYLYKTNLAISSLFYLTLVVVHGFLTLAISGPLAGAGASPAAVAFMTQTVTPKIEAEIRTVNEELASVAPARNQAAEEAARLQDQIDQSRAEQIEVQKQIDTARNSESYLYSQIVKIHARGDLTAARDQFTAFLGRFPHGALTGLAQGQLVQITSELAALDAQRQQASAAKVRLAARAQASLLARAQKGQATLSELRETLLGKTRAEVSALFGSPSETASDRWGFRRQMVLNPLTNEKSGLAVYFTDGLVQGVDYYYGTGEAR